MHGAVFLCGVLRCRVWGAGSMDPKDLKTALFCISFLRRAEVLAYVGRIHNLKDLGQRASGGSWQDREGPGQLAGQAFGWQDRASVGRIGRRLAGWGRPPATRSELFTPFQPSINFP